jgi:hypothetical protein
MVVGETKGEARRCASGGLVLVTLWKILIST